MICTNCAFLLKPEGFFNPFEIRPADGNRRQFRVFKPAQTRVFEAFKMLHFGAVDQIAAMGCEKTVLGQAFGRFSDRPDAKMPLAIVFIYMRIMPFSPDKGHVSGRDKQRGAVALAGNPLCPRRGG